LASSRPQTTPTSPALAALVTTWTLSIGGLTVYLMFFEARPRYLVAMLPLVVALVSAVWPPTAHRPAQR
jgi:hypothetical protein